MKYPDIDACKSILAKLQIDQSSVDLSCQDWEYTVADEDRLAEYLKLYKSAETNENEKRVLGCFIMQSMENQISGGNKESGYRSNIELLFKDSDINQSELEYWACLESSNSEEQFHISPVVREVINA